MSRDGDPRWFRPPPVHPVSTVGAGDSMVAGISAGLASGRSLAEAVRLGVAAGTAAVLTPGTELCDAADVERLVDQVAG
jgi:6-phosphofructokinase 2